MLPPYNSYGYLPPGNYQISCDAFRDYFSGNKRREKLVNGFFHLAKLLAEVGCTQIWIGGSLVTDKEFPNDFDGCFDRTEIDWYSSQLDPVLIDSSEQAKRFGGSLVADTMFHFQDFLKTDRQNRLKGIIEINPQELLDKTP
jgi:hypothetical protein